MPARLIALVCLLPLVACSDKARDPAPKAPASKAPADPAADFAQALAAVHGARAAGVGLEFDAGKVDKDRVLAARPKGWAESRIIPGSFKPPKEQNLGFMTSYRVGTNCDGTCTAKDWKAVAEKVDLGQFRNADKFEVQRESALSAPEGTLIVAKSKGGFGEKVYIAAARWKKGANRYYNCHVTLDGPEAAKLASAFAKACEVNLPLFLK